MENEHTGSEGEPISGELLSEQTTILSNKLSNL